MVIVKKVLNSSVVLAEDDQEKEFILLSKGIGFGKKRGAPIEDLQNTQIFIPIQNKRDKQLLDILSSIPYELFMIAQEITDGARKILKTELNESLYFLLAEHLAFAIKRQQMDMHIKNHLFLEIKNMYPEQFEIGMRGLELIESHLEVKLPEEEAANIAFHIVNAQISDHHTQKQRQQSSLICDILQIIQNEDAPNITAEDSNYARLSMHLQLFAERFFDDALLHNEEEAMSDTAYKKYPQELQIVQDIAQFLENKYHRILPDEEKILLMVHINRIRNNELVYA